MRVNDSTLLAGAGIALAVALFAWPSKASELVTRPWTPEEYEHTGAKLKSFGIKGVLLPSMTKAPTPSSLLDAQQYDFQKLATLSQDLLTAVFAFSDRGGELYRALGNQWVRDTALERRLIT